MPTTDSLLRMDDEEFEAVVNDDIHESSTSYTELLRAPEVADRWYRTLVRIKQNVEAQFVSMKSDISAKRAETAGVPGGEEEYLRFVAEKDQWKRGAIRFRNAVERRLMEAKLYRPPLRNDAETQRLRQAIKEHRETLLADDQEPHEADEALWMQAT